MATDNNDPDWVSNGKQTARKCFQEDLYAESGQTWKGSLTAAAAAAVDRAR